MTKQDVQSSKTTVIAISGWKGSGKDTLAEYLVSRYGAERLSFADSLKNHVSRQFRIYRNLIDSRETKEMPLLEYPVDPQDRFSQMIVELMKQEFRMGEDGREYWTPRALCVLIGSVMRSVNPHVWVDRVVSQMDAGGTYVISDLRYRSEVRSLQRHSDLEIITVRLNRYDRSPSEDPSERDLDNYDFDLVIENRGTIEDLKFIADRTLGRKLERS